MFFILLGLKKMFLWTKERPVHVDPMQVRSSELRFALDISVKSFLCLLAPLALGHDCGDLLDCFKRCFISYESRCLSLNLIHLD